MSKLRVGLGAAACIVVGAALFGCKSNNINDTTNNNTNNSSSTATIGPNGGSVSLDGAEVKFPAGALSTNTSITLAVAQNAPALPSGYNLVGNVFAMEPHGIVFAGTVTVELPVGDAGAAALVYHATCPKGTTSASSCSWDTLITDAAIRGSQAVFATPTFSLYAVVTATSPFVGSWDCSMQVVGGHSSQETMVFTQNANGTLASEGSGSWGDAGTCSGSPTWTVSGTTATFTPDTTCTSGGTEVTINSMTVTESGGKLTFTENATMSGKDAGGAIVINGTCTRGAADAGSAGKDAGKCATDPDAGVCNCVQLVDQNFTSSCQDAGGPPAMTGGTIADGTYVLQSVTDYGDCGGGEGGPTQATVTISESGTNWQVAIGGNMGDGGFQTVTESTTFKLQGNALVAQSSCMPAGMKGSEDAGPPEITYSVNGSNIETVGMFGDNDYMVWSPK